MIHCAQCYIKPEESMTGKFQQGNIICYMQEHVPANRFHLVYTQFYMPSAVCHYIAACRSRAEGIQVVFGPF